MNNNSIFKKFLIVVALIIVALFGHLFLTSKIKVLNKQSEILNAELARKQDILDSKIVLLQKLSSEERIVKIAREKLGLVRSSKMFEKIWVNENRIKRLEKIVNSKYE
jgi:cell division protein FtsL